jgi:predicted dehydrogenase
MDSRLGPDNRALLVIAGMHHCDEHIRSAMKRNFHVLKLPPPARDFEEAAKFVRLADEVKVQFAVAEPSRYSKSFLTFGELVRQNRIEQVFLLTGLGSFGDQQYPGWQADPKLAGGGVLLHNCYWLIDQIVHNFGLPQQIYSLNTNQAQDKRQRLYLTEDTAIVTMKFTDTFIGNLIVSRRGGIGPGQEYLQLYGKDKIFLINQTELTIKDGQGGIIEHFKYDYDRTSCMKELLNGFALSILSPGDNKPVSSGKENLQNMAVIESAYLSARTGFPEEPARILQMASSAAREGT